MKIITAKNIGFCFGVKKAISIAEKALKEKTKPVQFLGNLVHNENIVAEFLKKGVIFRKKIREIKPGILIIQAHGFPPLPRNLNNTISIKDATCPLVKKNQILTNSLYKQGYRIIIVGDRRHSEVQGIKARAMNGTTIVKNKKEAARLPNFKKVAIVSQTTQDLNNVNEVLKTLKEKYKKIKYFNTLCPEVQNRQKEAKSIAKKSAAILIIGSKISANTKQLYQISKKSGKPVFWVNSLKELKKKKIGNPATLGLLSGTSADNSEIKKIVKYLKKK